MGPTIMTAHLPNWLQILLEVVKVTVNKDGLSHQLYKLHDSTSKLKNKMIIESYKDDTTT